MTYLAMVDRAFRGTVEAQFFEALYGIVEFSDMMGGFDVVLRGTAVTAASAADPELPAVRLGAADVVLPSPRTQVRRMLERGMPVWADEPSLAVLGLRADDLLPGVRCLDTTTLAMAWADYDGVWYM